MKQIILSQGKVTLVDDEDFEKFSLLKWCAHKMKSGRRANYYASRIDIIDGKRVQRLLHRDIMNAPKGMVVDHINGDTLDNRKENLRIVTNQENCLNRTGPVRAASEYRGVYRTPGGQWTSFYRVLGEVRQLGTWPTRELAAAARDYEFIKRGIFTSLAFDDETRPSREEVERNRVDRYGHKRAGITKRGKGGRFCVVVTRNGKQKYLGTFDSEEEAVQIREHYLANLDR